VIQVTGIDHLHLHVEDIHRALAFYRDAFGAEEAFRVDEKLVFVRLGGGQTLIALDGRPQGDRNPAHAGLTLSQSTNLDDAVRAIERAGGTLVQRGEHAPGIAYAYVADSDGNVLELS
jgi:predicted enzyme related to lactoylglutathione lyase